MCHHERPSGDGLFQFRVEWHGLCRTVTSRPAPRCNRISIVRLFASDYYPRIVPHMIWTLSMVTRAVVTILALCCITAATSGYSAELDIAAVRRLAQQPVHEILQG